MDSSNSADLPPDSLTGQSSQERLDGMICATTSTEQNYSCQLANNDHSLRNMESTRSISNAILDKSANNTVTAVSLNLPALSLESHLEMSSLSSVTPVFLTKRLHDSSFSHVKKRIRVEEQRRLNTEEEIKCNNKLVSVTSESDTIVEGREKCQLMTYSKDELQHHVTRLDSAIIHNEMTIAKLRNKLQLMEDALIRNDEDKNVEDKDIPKEPEPMQSKTQIIFAENRRKAELSHSFLNRYQPMPDLPIYTRPSHTAVYHENKRKFIAFKKKLMLSLKNKNRDEMSRMRHLNNRYNELHLLWQKEIDMHESSDQQRVKDVEMREYFDKVFPEMRKQEEEKYQWSSSSLISQEQTTAKSDLDDPHKQMKNLLKRLRSLSVMPPPLLDAQRRKLCYLNENGLIHDPVTVNGAMVMKCNLWMDYEKEIFVEKFIKHPKKFGLIASFLDNKTAMDCVQFYYFTKKEINYKKLVRRLNTNRKKFRGTSAVKEDKFEGRNSAGQILRCLKENHSTPKVLSTTTSVEESKKKTVITEDLCSVLKIVDESVETDSEEKNVGLSTADNIQSSPKISKPSEMEPSANVSELVLPKPNLPEHEVEQKSGSSEYTVEQNPNSSEHAVKQKSHSPEHAVEQKPNSPKHAVEQKSISPEHEEKLKSISSEDEVEPKQNLSEHLVELKLNSPEHKAEPKPISPENEIERNCNASEQNIERHETGRSEFVQNVGYLDIINRPISAIVAPVLQYPVVVDCGGTNADDNDSIATLSADEEMPPSLVETDDLCRYQESYKRNAASGKNIDSDVKENTASNNRTYILADRTDKRKSYHHSLTKPTSAFLNSKNIDVFPTQNLRNSSISDVTQTELLRNVIFSRAATNFQPTSASDGVESNDLLPLSQSQSYPLRNTVQNSSTMLQYTSIASGPFPGMRSVDQNRMMSYDDQHHHSVVSNSVGIRSGDQHSQPSAIYNFPRRRSDIQNAPGSNNVGYNSYEIRSSDQNTPSMMYNSSGMRSSDQNTPSNMYNSSVMRSGDQQNVNSDLAFRRSPSTNNTSSPACIRDLIHAAIESSLQQEKQTTTKKYDKNLIKSSNKSNFGFSQRLSDPALDNLEAEDLSMRAAAPHHRDTSVRSGYTRNVVKTLQPEISSYGPFVTSRHCDLPSAAPPPPPPPPPAHSHNHRNALNDQRDTGFLLELATAATEYGHLNRTQRLEKDLHKLAKSAAASSSSLNPIYLNNEEVSASKINVSTGGVPPMNSKRLRVDVTSKYMMSVDNNRVADVRMIVPGVNYESPAASGSITRGTPLQAVQNQEISYIRGANIPENLYHPLPHSVMTVNPMQYMAAEPSARLSPFQVDSRYIHPQATVLRVSDERSSGLMTCKNVLFGDYVTSLQMPPSNREHPPHSQSQLHPHQHHQQPSPRSTHPRSPYMVYPNELMFSHQRFPGPRQAQLPVEQQLQRDTHHHHPDHRSNNPPVDKLLLIANERRGKEGLNAAELIEAIIYSQISKQDKTVDKRSTDILSRLSDAEAVQSSDSLACLQRLEESPMAMMMSSRSFQNSAKEANQTSREQPNMPRNMESVNRNSPAYNYSPNSRNPRSDILERSMTIGDSINALITNDITRHSNSLNDNADPYQAIMKNFLVDDQDPSLICKDQATQNNGSSAGSASCASVSRFLVTSKISSTGPIEVNIDDVNARETTIERNPSSSVGCSVDNLYPSLKRNDIQRESNESSLPSSIHWKKKKMFKEQEMQKQMMMTTDNEKMFTASEELKLHHQRFSHDSEEISDHLIIDEEEAIDLNSNIHHITSSSSSSSMTTENRQSLLSSKVIYTRRTSGSGSDDHLSTIAATHQTMSTLLSTISPRVVGRGESRQVDMIQQQLKPRSSGGINKTLVNSSSHQSAYTPLRTDNRESNDGSSSSEKNQQFNTTENTERKDSSKTHFT